MNPHDTENVGLTVRDDVRSAPIKAHSDCARRCSAKRRAMTLDDARRRLTTLDDARRRASSSVVARRQYVNFCIISIPRLQYHDCNDGHQLPYEIVITTLFLLIFH